MASTLIFPISGNPIGFNHFAAAEAVLCQNRALERLLFVLSNGRHPDPTKADAEVAPHMRLELCERSISAIADTEACYLARQAELAGERLVLSPERLSVSTLELAFQRAVRTAELIPLLRGQLDDARGRLPWIAGSDLIRRMADRRIFSDADLAVLAESCHFHILERECNPLMPALKELRATRGVALHYNTYPREALAGWLAPFTCLSSTLIRNAAEAGDPLAGMLPQPATARIEEEGLYREGTLGARLIDGEGNEMGRRSGLDMTLEALRARLDDEAGALAALLARRREGQRPHSLSLVETTTGGLMTAALAARSGASRYFRQSRFAYDAHGKSALVGGRLPGESAVSRAAVEALAEAMRREARTDYAIAESGMAGPPDAGRRSFKYGLCWIAFAAADGKVSECLELNPFLTRREHQLHFAQRALSLARQALEGRWRND